MLSLKAFGPIAPLSLQVCVGDKVQQTAGFPHEVPTVSIYVGMKNTA